MWTAYVRGPWTAFTWPGIPLGQGSTWRIPNGPSSRVLTGALPGDVGVVVVDDGLGVERPRPVVLGGALVVMATGSSSM
jgi:hypothetical protein